MDRIIHRSQLKGTYFAQPSKSLAHRYLMCAGLSKGTSIIDNVVLSQDIKATINGMKEWSLVTLSPSTRFSNRTKVTVEGTSKQKAIRHIDCYESGTTLRFYSLICAAMGGKTHFTGTGRLPKRPMSPVFDIYQKEGIRYTQQKDVLPLTIEGKLKGGRYELLGNVSSQYISGLLMALGSIKKGGNVVIKPPFESKGYVDLTVEVLKHFGIQVEEKAMQYLVLENQTYRSHKGHIGGDWSNSGYFYVMKALGAKIDMKGLEKTSIQPDAKIQEYLLLQGEKVIDIAQSPDLFPALCVWGATQPGSLRIINGQRLRLKESDRIEAMGENLKNIGIQIQYYPDGIWIKGDPHIEGGVVEAFNDHRIVMAFTSLAPVIHDTISIKDTECVEKSYPEFFDDFISLGGKVT